MEISEKAILSKTHYGLSIYSFILRSFYPDEIVLHLSGKKCKPAKNPFLNGEETLLLENRDWVFYYEDATNPNFKGNPVEFASLFFKLEGQDLLRKINEELNLNIGKKRGFYANAQNDDFFLPEVIKPRIIVPKFSFFKRPVKNTIPDREVSLLDVYKLVKGDTYSNTTQIFRTIEDKIQARQYKANSFDYVTFSGIFKKRSDNNLLKHSGLLTIDFDHIPNTSSLRDNLLNDEYFDTELLFVSPSGDGLKWIVKIDLTTGSHQLLFNAISAYIKKTYQLEVDKSGKDISRACFLPYDNNIYINPKYLQ